MPRYHIVSRVITSRHDTPLSVGAVNHFNYVLLHRPLTFLIGSAGGQWPRPDSPNLEAACQRMESWVQFAVI